MRDEVEERMDVTGTSGERASRMLAIYLRNHEAGARGGVDLFRRLQANQSGRPWGADLGSLAQDVEDDLGALHRLMRGWGVPPDPWAGLAVRVAERVGRLKPNGHLLTRSPLSDLVEVEAGFDAVHAKSAGWQALRAASTPATSVDLEELSRRADDQLVRLRALHATVAAAVL